MGLLKRFRKEATYRPKVSVLVPCFNVESYLPQCLESLIGQTLNEIEIICVNDGSTDSTLSIIEEYARRDGRIKIIDKPNSGYGASMNAGLDLATGDYVGITESDDFASLGMYKSLFIWAKRKRLDLVKSNFYNYIDGTDNKTEIFADFPNKVVFDPIEYPQIIGTVPSIWAAIYRREMIESMGIRFSETPGASFQDTAFVLQGWFAAKRVLLLPQAYLHYRNDNPNSSVKSSAKVYAVCDEFERADVFMNCDLERRRRFVPYFVSHRFNTYRWNYNRIAYDYREEFAKRMREDIVRMEEKNELNVTAFTPENWRILQELLCDLDSFSVKYRKGL